MKALKLSLTFFFFLILIAPVLAFQGSTDNLNMTISNAGYSANYGESANFKLDFSLVDQPLGAKESTNFKAQLGFFWGAFIEAIAGIVSEYWALALMGGVIGIGGLLLFISQHFDMEEHWLFRYFLIFASALMFLIGINIGINVAIADGTQNVLDNISTFYWVWNWLFWIGVASFSVAILWSGMKHLRQAGEVS